MSAAPLPVGLGEDQRAELAAIAARTQHANQPRNVVLLAGLLAAVAILILSVAWRANASALEQAELAQDRARAAASKAAELRALEQAGATRSSEVNEPIARMLSRIERAGVDAGLKNQIPVPGQRAGTVERRLGTRQMQLTYQLRDPSFEALARFMQRAVQEVPGLEVYSIRIRPEQQNWFLEVVFSRWERAEGG
jgi:cell division protein FtsB